MKYFIINLLFAGSLLLTTGCTKFLDKKANQNQSVPDNLEDLELLLDNFQELNRSLDIPNVSTDEYFLKDADYAARYPDQKMTYTWDPRAIADFDWIYMYKIIYIANNVLEHIEKVDRATDPSRWDAIKGAAFFFRGYALFQLSQEYAPHFPGNEQSALGLPLRSGSDFNKVVSRSTLKETYDQFINDLNNAVSLLPSNNYPPSRPSRMAVFALLARIHLLMENYQQAYDYSDSCLRISAALLDYNTIDGTPQFPFPRYNEEVIFYVASDNSFTVLNDITKIDTTLYRSYEEGDLRKELFFMSNGDGTHYFRGNYTNSYYFFHGLATDEVYLTKAESAVRTGKTDEALISLNALLRKRWVPASFKEVTIREEEALLALILRERKKELVFRSTRWSDLRRLNRDPRFQITLKRLINGKEYTLPPGDLRYVFLIPAQSITVSGIPQNPR